MQKKGVLVCFVLSLIFVYALLTNSAIAFIRDSEFLELCISGSLQEINDAIIDGANVNARSEGRDNTPLIVAAGSNTDAQVITALINAGADITRKSATNETPLMYAARYNLDPKAVEAMIKTLIEAGDEINARDNGGKTALYFAVDSLNVQAVSVLLDHGADAKIRDNFGVRPLDLAEVKKVFSRTEALRKLREAS